jgi:hypothetical protein
MGEEKKMFELVCGDFTDFQDRINHLAEEGFKPVGTMCMLKNNNGIFYFSMLMGRNHACTETDKNVHKDQSKIIEKIDGSCSNDKVRSHEIGDVVKYTDDKGHKHIKIIINVTHEFISLCEMDQQSGCLKKSSDGRVDALILPRTSRKIESTNWMYRL